MTDTPMTDTLTTDTFDYELPEELIAQEPLERRDSSRLLVLRREDGLIEHKDFPHIKEYLREGDLVVFNDTRVIPARLVGKKPTGGAVEVFLLSKAGDGGGGETWQCFVRSSKGVKEGARYSFEGGGEDSGKALSVKLLKKDPLGVWTAEVTSKDGTVSEAIEAIGHVPLPPYITREDTGADKERYQTVFASKDGAVAAPTAGLHFTPEIIDDIKAAGVDVRYLTLHTGAATFMPVRAENVKDHRVPPEFFSIPGETLEAVKKARADGRRVVAVGSTVTRALETAFLEEDGGEGSRLEGSTGIFIYPPYAFKAVDAMITNFHLPRSSLLMMVAAFAGTEVVLAAYREAVRERYRFYSYGDCMLIL